MLQNVGESFFGEADRPILVVVEGSRFEVDVKVRFLKPGAFDVQNLVTIPQTKLLKKLGELDSEQLSQVEDVLLFWLGFEDMNFDEKS